MDPHAAMLAAGINLICVAFKEHTFTFWATELSAWPFAEIVFPGSAAISWVNRHFRLTEFFFAKNLYSIHSWWVNTLSKVCGDALNLVHRKCGSENYP